MFLHWYIEQDSKSKKLSKKHKTSQNEPLSSGTQIGISAAYFVIDQKEETIVGKLM